MVSTTDNPRPPAGADVQSRSRIPCVAVGSGLRAVFPATFTDAQRHWAHAHQFKGERHQVLAHANPLTGAISEVWVGVGEADGFESCEAEFFRALSDKLPPGQYCLSPDALSAEQATQALIAFEMGRYRYARYKSEGPKDVSLALNRADLAAVSTMVSATTVARDLINTPAEDCGPEQLCEAVKRLLLDHPGVVREWVGEDLIHDGFRLIHAVGRAASQPPRLIEVQFERDPRAPWISVVGKGVCFDTGGLDMKTSAGMALMKKDMGGAAVSIGLAHWILRTALPVNLQLIIPAVINAVGADSVRPSDVIRSKQGTHVEITNTDAEGRLVLAEGLALVRPDAQLILDMATLTGAARVALGPEVPAVFCHPQTLWPELQTCAHAVGESLWQLPLVESYRDDLKSKIADLVNSASHSFAGAIMGALFLQHFIPKGKDWVHIDLYGWNPKDRPGYPVGAEAHALKSVAAWLKHRFGKH